MQAFPTINDARDFALAGRAILTLESRRTSAHYTYKVRVSKDNPKLHFVNLLTSGSADEGEFTYLGVIRDGRFTLTAKSRLTKEAPSVKAFSFFFGLAQLHPELVIHHEGKCGRCGRTLTVPESIERGIGPECSEKMGGAHQ